MARDNKAGDAAGAAQDAARAAKGFVVDEVLGKEEWKRSKVGFLTGFSTVTDNVSSLGTLGGESVGRVRTLFAKAFSPTSTGIAVEEGIDDPAMRFREAMRVNGKTLTDVNRSCGVTYRQFWLFAGLTAFTLLLGVFLVGTMAYQGHFNPFGCVFAFLPLPLVGALTLRAGYTNWMFRRRRLDSLGAYLRSGHVTPRRPAPAPTPVGAVTVTRRTPPSRGTVVKSLAMVAVLGCATIGSAPEAHAQNNTASSTTSTTQSTDPATLAQQVVGTPNDGDLFVKMLGVIVPNVGPVPAGTFGSNNPTATATKTALGIFAGVLLFLGITINGYQILTGLVASAKEGKALGEKYHEVWAPLRVVVGYGFLTPLLGGLCAAQVLVLYMIVWGGNMANIVWSAYANDLLSQYTQSATGTSDTRGANQSSVASQASVAEATKVVRDLAKKSLCLGVVKYDMQTRTISASVPDPTWHQVGSTGWVAGFNSEIDGSLSGSEQSVTASCGAFRIYNDAGSSSNATTVSKNGINTAAEGAVGQILPIIWQQMSQYAQTYVHSGGTGAPAFGPNGTASTSTLTSAIQTYASAIDTAAKTWFTNNDATAGAQSQVQAVKTTIATEGWASSGTFYLTLSRLSAAMYSGFQQAQDSSNYNQDAVTYPDSETEDLVNGSKNHTGLLTQFDQWYSAKIGAANVEVDNNSISPTDTAIQAAKSFASSTPTLEFFNQFMMSIVNRFSSLLDTNPFQALQQLSDLGNLMIYTAEGMFILTSAGTGISGMIIAKGAGAAGMGGEVANTFTAGAVGVLAAAGGGILGGIMTLGNTLVFGLMAAGILHAYVLPMIPYIMTTFFVLGMIMLVVESLVAAPLWAFFHIRMEGSEFVDQVQKPGYMIAFNLLLRPTLMIFGLILSNGVFGAMVFFTSHTFMPVIGSMNSSNTLGPIGVVVMIVMMGYIHYQLAVRSFSLITKLPDRVSRWFGQGGEQLGEDHHSDAAVAFVGGHIERGATSSLGAVKGKQQIQQGAGAGRKPRSEPGEAGARPPAAVADKPEDHGTTALPATGSDSG